MCKDKFRDCLYEAIRDESDKNGQGLHDVLKELIGSKVTVSFRGRPILTIIPYWAELYHSFEGEERLIDPFCDHHKNKKKDGALFFKSFSYREGHPWYRNRLDICLGEGKDEISILLKRASVCDENGKQILSKERGAYLTDYYIAKAVFDKLCLCLNKKDLTEGDFACLSYSLKLRESPIEGVGFSRRINLSKKKDKRGYRGKEYACYDSTRFAPDGNRTKIKTIGNRKKHGGSL